MIKKEELRLFEQKYQELRNTYRYLVNANIKLVDENKELNRRIGEAINYINEEHRYSNLGGMYEFYGDPEQVIKILEGSVEYEDEEEKDEYMAHY